MLIFIMVGVLLVSIFTGAIGHFLAGGVVAVINASLVAAWFNTVNQATGGKASRSMFTMGGKLIVFFSFALWPLGLALTALIVVGWVFVPAANAAWVD